MIDKSTPIPGLTEDRVREIMRDLAEPLARGDLLETMAAVATYIATHDARIANLERRAES